MAQTEDDAWTRFTAPDAAHLPAAYWFWQHIPGPTEIRRQVGELHAAGYHSFQIQSRLSLPMADHLSAPWLDAYAQAIDEASRRGMVVGIYDDYNWQSGHAAGRAVADGHDHHRERHIFWATGTVRDGAVDVGIEDVRLSSSLGPPVMDWLFEGGRIEWSDWEVVAAVAHAAGGTGHTDVREAATIVETTPDGCRVRVSVAAGVERVTLFVGARCATSRMTNPMDPAAVARFTEAGYRPVADAVRRHLGSTVRYLFFDQPHANHFTWAGHHGDLRNTLPYSRPYLDDLEARFPGGVPTLLMAVLGGTTPEARRLRARFYQHHSAWAMESWLGTVRRWTHANGLELAGHEVLGHVGSWDLAGAFSDWDLRVDFGLDHFGVDSYRDLTAADAQDSVSQLSAKFADSVARSNGRSGAMVEQYYADPPGSTGTWTGHWGLTPEELRASTIRHHLLGMRQLVFHGFYLSDGVDDWPVQLLNPRFDFPPGLNYEPWFTTFHPPLALESGRLSEFFEGTQAIGDVAVLYPLRSTWVDGQGGQHAAQSREWFGALLHGGYDFHLIDERDLLRATVRDERLHLGDRSYGALVLPGITALLSRAVTDRLRTLAAGGVRVVATGSSPDTYQEGEGSAADDWSDLLATTAARQLSGVPNPSHLAEVLGRPAIHLAVEGGAHVWQRVARSGAGYRIALFNDSSTAQRIRLTLPAASDPVDQEWLLDPPGVQLLPDAGADTLLLAPMQLRLFTAGLPAPERAAPLPAVPESASPRGPGLPLAEGWTVRVTPIGEQSPSPEQPVSVDEGLHVQGLAGFSGTATYFHLLHAREATGFDLSLPSVVGGVLLHVNGEPVGGRGWTPHSFSVPAGLVRPGGNELRLEVQGTAANHYYAGSGLRLSAEPSGILRPPEVTWHRGPAPS